ncbi:MAG: PAS domain S-box protein, partial [Limisphaerales bacterium]
MDHAVSLVCDTLGTDFCKVLQLLPDQRSLLLLSGCGWKAGLVGKAIVGAGINSQAGHTLRTGRFVVCEDLASERRFQGPPLLTDHGVTSGMSAPIRGEVGVWGVLGTHTKRKRRFTAIEQDFFQSVANILSAAVQRSSQNHIVLEIDENRQLALQIANIGTWQIDPRTRLTTRDSSLNRIYGLEPVDSTQPIEEFLSLVHPEDRGRILDHFYHALETRQFTEIDFRIVRPDGEVRCLHGRGRVLQSGTLAGAVIDITERKKAENSTAQLAAIISSSQDAIIGCNVEGKISSWNASAERIFGYPAQEMIGKTVHRLIPADRFHELRNVAARLKRGEKCESFDTVRSHKDGGLLDVSISVSVVRDSQGEAIGTSAIVRDISRRKQTEIALRQNEARLRLALNTGHLGIWEWEINSNRITWSPNLEAIHGLLPGTFDGTFEMFAAEIAPEERERVLKRIKESLEQETEFQIEYRLANGKWVEGHGCVIVDQRGAPERMVGVCADISKRKQAEDSLRESEQRFRALADAAPMMIWMSDESGNCIYLNKTWARFRGCPIENDLGDGWKKAVHKEDLEESLRRFRIAFENRANYDLTYRLKRFDGEYRTIFETGVPRFGVDGSFSGYMATMVDVSDLKAAEETLRKEAALLASEARFRELADAMPQIVWEATAEGTFDYFNKRWHEYSGIENNEGAIELWKDFAHPDDWPKCLDNLQRSFETGSPFQSECRFRNAATGAYQWHLSRALPIRDDNGKILRWIGTATNIEDYKLIERELTEAKVALSDRASSLEKAVKERTRELEESLNTTETLLYTIAHDLRAPLRAMQGLSMAVLEDYAFRLDDDGREFLNRINHSAQRMDKL